MSSQSPVKWLEYLKANSKSIYTIFTNKIADKNTVTKSGITKKFITKKFIFDGNFNQLLFQKSQTNMTASLTNFGWSFGSIEENAVLDDKVIKKTSRLKYLVVIIATPITLGFLSLFAYAQLQISTHQVKTEQTNINSVTTDSDVPIQSKSSGVASQHKQRMPFIQEAGISQDMSSRHQYQLDNGLKVIIKEDHRSPVVMTQIWYKVGSSEEPDNLGGISHLLEHMMFKGTSKVTGEEYEKLVAKYGGTNNAFTSYDFTGYYEYFPANRYALALELEADRMKNLEFDIDDFTQERQVVMEERRQRTDDNPISKSYEEFRLLALPNSPKGESVIGPMAEIESITLDDLQSWYSTWYTPNNATLVIVGDVNPDEVMTQVKKYFSDIKPAILPKRADLQEKGFRGYQHNTTKQAVKVPTLMMGFNVPAIITAQLPSLYGQPDTNVNAIYSLSLLQNILDGGLSARLESQLVRKKNILASVAASYNMFNRGDELFWIQATPREGVSLKQAEQEIMREIDKLKVEGITNDELNRAKTATINEIIYSQDSMSGQANIIGSMQTIGLDDRLLSNLPTKLSAFRQEELQKIARRYLIRNNLTVLDVLPND